MRYKQEFLNDYDTKKGKERAKAFIKLVERREKEFNKEIDELTVNELQEFINPIKARTFIIDNIKLAPIDTYSLIRNYLDVASETRINSI